jgi:endonuclease/exonuclease/phosphatase family metal-dependent hydrolase
MRIPKRLLFPALLAAAACTPGINYLSVDGPRYAGAPAPRLVTVAAQFEVPALRFVTFNIRYGEAVDSAIAVLRDTPALEPADVVALQEVDAAGTERIAAALGMAYVYYPATFHPKFERDFGNAVLSRWPIVDDGKVLLPHWGRFRQTARTATAATISVGGATIRVYSVHLGTMAEISSQAKREQADVLLAAAAAHPRVVILGDMNSFGLGQQFRAAGYEWATRDNPRTFAVGRWDHIFLRGVSLAETAATGVVRQTRGASDHRPVWALIAPPER